MLDRRLPRARGASRCSSRRALAAHGDVAGKIPTRRRGSERNHAGHGSRNLGGWISGSPRARGRGGNKWVRFIGRRQAQNYSGEEAR